MSGNNCGKRVLIVGGSTRAAAWSARRAGWQPICADMFADVDTRGIAEVIPIRDFPRSLPDDVAHVRADGWFYTGGLENSPDLIARMESAAAAYGPLWGTGPSALRLIRDPFWVESRLRHAGWPALKVRGIDPVGGPHLLQGRIEVRSRTPVADGTWMLKPLKSAGGRAVDVWNENRALREIEEAVYFQERRHGDILSALFRTSQDSVELLGMTRQLPNDERSGASEPYAYCGSLGPLPTDAATIHSGCRSDFDHYECLGRQLTAMARLLAADSGMRGLFGVDFIQDDQGVPWIVEVNPRYTASVEILELACRQSLLAPERRGSRFTSDAQAGRQVVAKQVLYASRPITTPDFSHGCDFSHPWEVPELADIPIPGSRIDAGWPICTVIAAASTSEECLRRLRGRVDTVRKMVNDPGDDCSVLDRFRAPR